MAVGGWDTVNSVCPFTVNTINSLSTPMIYLYEKLCARVKKIFQPEITHIHNTPVLCFFVKMQNVVKQNGRPASIAMSTFLLQLSLVLWCPTLSILPMSWTKTQRYSSSQYIKECFGVDTNSCAMRSKTSKSDRLLLDKWVKYVTSCKLIN